MSVGFEFDQVEERNTLPEFDIEYSFDERRHPSEVTIFPADEGLNLLTEWITIDVEHAVPLEEVH